MSRPPLFGLLRVTSWSAIQVGAAHGIDDPRHVVASVEPDAVLDVVGDAAHVGSPACPSLAFAAGCRPACLLTVPAAATLARQEETIMDYLLDFSGRTVLVVGGTSGIGNATARAFLDRGATVHVWGTRASAADYAADEGSDLSGLGYTRMDATDFEGVKACDPGFRPARRAGAEPGHRALQAQGVRDRRLSSRPRREPHQPDGHLPEVPADARGFARVDDHPQFRRRFPCHAGQPAYNASKAGATGLTRTLARPGPIPASA